MAEDLTLEQILQRVQAPAPEQQIQQPTQERGFASLLGSALGGGSADRIGTADDETAGRRALLNFGIQMLDASGPSPTKRSFGQILARGLSGAAESQAGSEAVTAAKMGAQQEARQKAQELRIAALKEAIPLLTLQQKQRAAAGMPGSLTGTSIGAVGGGADPVAGMSKEEARAAIAQRESGNQNIFSQIKVPGRSQEELGSGYYQIIPSTWAEGAKLAGVDVGKYPLAINAPKELQDKVFDALWDKYGAKPWAQSAPKAAPGAATTTTAATTPPDAKTPPAAPAAPQATPLPPEPPPGMLPSPEPESAPAPGNVAGRRAGGAVVAGPAGAASVGGARPAGPAVAGDVNAIIRGMVGAGADSGTLAAGASQGGDATLLAGAPTASPADVAKAQARATNTPVAVAGVDGLWAMPNGLVTGQRPPGLPGGPAPAAEPTQQPPAQQPPTVQPRAPLYVRPPLTEDERKSFDPNLPPETKQAFEREYQSALREGDTAAARKVQDEYGKAMAARAQQAQQARASYNIEQQRLEQTARIEETKRDAADAKDAADRAHAIQLKGIEGEQTRLTNREQVKNKASQDLQDSLTKDTLAARKRVDALEAALQLSSNVKDATVLGNTSIGGVATVDLLKGLGIGTDKLQNEVGNIQELRAALLGVAKSMKEGVALGAVSDKDMDFILGMGPSLMMDASTREAVIGNLIGQQRRQMKFGTEVSKLLSKGMDIGDAIDEADKRLGQVTPLVPDDIWNAPRGDEKAKAWFKDNVPNNTIYRTSDGVRHIMHPPGWTPPKGYGE